MCVIDWFWSVVKFREIKIKIQLCFLEFRVDNRSVVLLFVFCFDELLCNEFSEVM